MLCNSIYFWRCFTVYIGTKRYSLVRDWPIPYSLKFSRKLIFEIFAQIYFRAPSDLKNFAWIHFRPVQKWHFCTKWLIFSVLCIILSLRRERGGDSSPPLDDNPKFLRNRIFLRIFFCHQNLVRQLLAQFATRSVPPVANVGHRKPLGSLWPYTILNQILKMLQIWRNLVIWSIFGRRSR